MINTILAFTRPLQERDGLTPEQWLRQDFGGDWLRTTWREPEIANRKRIVFDVLLPDEAALDAIQTAHPDVIVIGSWDRDTGAQKRALYSLAIDIMPDSVTCDEEGNEISRERPTKPRDHHVWAGQTPRDWGGGG